MRWLGLQLAVGEQTAARLATHPPRFPLAPRSMAMYIMLCLCLGFVYFQLGDSWKDV